MSRLLSININNVSAISATVSHGQFLIERGAKIMITWSMMKEMTSLLEIRPEISTHLHDMPAFIQEKQYDELWQFDHGFGTVYQPDFARGCIQMRLPDGNSIEIDIPILIELQCRYDKMDYTYV